MNTDTAPEDPGSPRSTLSRRALLGVTAAGGASLAAVRLWPGAGDDVGSGPTGSKSIVRPDSALVADVEGQRLSTGRTVTHRLTAQTAAVDLGGRTVETATFDGNLPGRELRVMTGDRLHVTLANQLQDPTSVHWHGLALRNDMDGVPSLTQSAVDPGAEFVYEFLAPHPGTYWFHPHVGVQLDRGLYAPLVVEDPNEVGAYDDEVVLLLDDWTDGWANSPDAILEGFRKDGMPSMAGMGDMEMPTGVSAEAPLGTDTGDVSYPAHLINGRLGKAPHVVRARQGQRLRIRLINAASDTAYRVAIGGHQMTVTHTDGFPVDPVTVDALIIGMGERYDVLIDVNSATAPVFALPEGKIDAPALALIQTRGSGGSTGGSASTRGDRILSYQDLRASESVWLEERTVDRELTMTLTMAEEGRQWLINGEPYESFDPLDVRLGDRVRLEYKNESNMFHPMHLHGHTFSVGLDGRGPRKDTVNVLPKSSLVVQFDADNPGQWLSHCHNAYHGELGMMGVVSYVM
jgi:FtsP/CotA-like multicopper oxidase with cupredoxin domain